MKLSDIRILAQLQINMEISMTVALKYANEGIETLAESFNSACVKDEIEINAVKDTWIDLPSNALQLLKVKKDNYDYEDFLIEHRKIMFKDDGTFKIDYLRYPTPLVNETDEPEFQEGFCKTLSYFIASRAINSKFGSENPEAVRLIREFYSRAEVLDVRLLNQKKNRKIKVPSFT